MKPMRHVAFGDNSDPDIMHIVPEDSVRFEITRHQGKPKLVAIFDGLRVYLPANTAAKFDTLEAITAVGGYRYHDNPSDSNQVIHLPDLPKGRN